MRTKLFLTFIISTVLALQASAETIKIRDFEDLCKIGKHPDFPLDGNYELTGNIDASESRNMNDGKGFEPIGKIVGYTSHGNAILDSAFTGIFDGKGYAIKGLYIRREQISDIGLFGYIADGEIKTLGLKDVSIFGNFRVGSLAGQLKNSKITDCYSTGEVHARYDYAGGLVGRSENSTIMNCYSTVNVETRTDYAGGLIGYLRSGTIMNCYSKGSVVGFTGLGGLVGEIYYAYNSRDVAITNCYSTGSVSSIINSVLVGGSIGYSSMDVTNNCFWDTETTKQSTSFGGEGRTTIQMKQQATYVGWDFENIWAIEEGQDYPYLQALGKTQTPTFVIKNKISCNAAAASAPSITIRGKTLNIKTSSPTSDLQIRLFDMRGKTLTRFNTRGSNSFSLSKISAGRYLVETKENGKRVGTAAVVLR